MSVTILSPPGRFKPLSETHPGVGTVCSLCGDPVRVGQRPALIEVGPADTDEERKAAAGRAYTAEAALVHESCVYPEVEPTGRVAR